MTAADDAVLVHWDAAPSFGVHLAVTTRHGGVSPGPYDSLNLGLHVGDDPANVIENRRRAAGAFGATLADLVFAQQVHGSATNVVGGADAGRGTHSERDAVAATDALLTSSPAVVLAILVADCLPLALVDPEAGVLAVVHAGWRGTAAGVVGRAVSEMAALGARPAGLAAFLGPAVSADRYQVGAEVHAGLRAAVAPEPLAPDVAGPDGASHWKVDLEAANRQQLERAGVTRDRIFSSGRRTSDPAFFSDRAARPCGRFALLAQLSS